MGGCPSGNPQESGLSLILLTITVSPKWYIFSRSPFPSGLLPIFSIVSKAAPISVVSVLSNAEGISISPSVFPSSDCKLTSILPILPSFVIL